jgi:hypothetical protein
MLRNRRIASYRTIGRFTITLRDNPLIPTRLKQAYAATCVRDFGKGLSPCPDPGLPIGQFAEELVRWYLLRTITGIYYRNGDVRDTNLNDTIMKNPQQVFMMRGRESQWRQLHTHLKGLQTVYHLGKFCPEYDLSRIPFHTCFTTDPHAYGTCTACEIERTEYYNNRQPQLTPK